jgi:predicted nucleic acid-binding protein
MSGYLLDTSVVSILSPGRKDATPELIDWMRGANERLYLSSVTVFEVSQGIAKLRRSGSIARANAYAIWLDDVVTGFESRLLSLEASTAKAAGELSDNAFSRGRHPGSLDILIAATAQVHDLTLLTRNVRHFEPLGIDVIDPLITLPG